MKKKPANQNAKRPMKQVLLFLGMILFVFLLSSPNYVHAAATCASRADIWFANDESGSVVAAEFGDSLNFMYQVSEGLVFSAATGAQAGVIGWASDASPVNIIVPITENFADPDDSGLMTIIPTPLPNGSFNNSTLITDGDGVGIRDLYQNKASTATGTLLDVATNRLATLINAGNGRRTAVPQIAVILTDANAGQLVESGRGGGNAWVAAANNLRLAGPDGTEVIVMVIDDTASNAAWAYNTRATTAAGDDDAKNIVDAAAGGVNNVFVGSTYTTIANPTNTYIDGLVNKICEVAQRAGSVCLNSEFNFISG